MNPLLFATIHNTYVRIDDEYFPLMHCRGATNDNLFLKEGDKYIPFYQLKDTDNKTIVVYAVDSLLFYVNEDFSITRFTVKEVKVTEKYVEYSCYESVNKFSQNFDEITCLFESFEEASQQFLKNIKHEN